MERGRGALYIYSDKDDQSILDFGEEEKLAGIFGYCCEESLNHFLSPEILAWEYFFFRGGGGINFWSKDIYIYVAVNFLFQLIFIFPLFWGMVMYANEFKTKEKQKLTEIKN